MTDSNFVKYYSPKIRNFNAAISLFGPCYVYPATLVCEEEGRLRGIGLIKGRG